MEAENELARELETLWGTAPSLEQLGGWLSDNSEAILSALRTPEAKPETDEVEAETVSKIAAMMAEFVDNWPPHKRLDTSLKLVAKTIRSLLDPPKHQFWGAGEPDCPREIKAGNGELHTLRCKVCGQDNPRDDRCLDRAIAALKQEAAPDVVGAIADIAAERQRQITAEGWTTEHDDAHDAGELAKAAACYAAASKDVYRVGPNMRGNAIVTRGLWPWNDQWWKPGTDRRRQLVKAGALILAEIERLDRILEQSHED